MLPVAPSRAPLPLSPTDFIDPTNWANEALEPGALRTQELRASLRALTEGNLSAIEDMNLTPGPHGFALPSIAAYPSAPPPGLIPGYTEPPADAIQQLSMRPRLSALAINKAKRQSSNISMVLIGVLAGVLLVVLAAVGWQLVQRK